MATRWVSNSSALPLGKTSGEEKPDADGGGEAMGRLKLTFSCSNLDRARPLIDGTAERGGIGLYQGKIGSTEARGLPVRAADPRLGGSGEVGALVMNGGNQ